MKHLLEVSKIVTKKKVQKIEIFDKYTLRQKNSKFNEFYEGLINDKFETDKEAAKYLYGKAKKDDKYRQLKSRFKKRLLNTLFFLDINTPATSNYNRAYYSCNKDWTLIRILLSNKAYETAAYLCRQLLSTALRFQFADLVVNCARILREHAMREGDNRSFEEYDAYSNRYKEILAAELQAEAYYQRILLDYPKLGAAEQETLHKEIKLYCQHIDQLARDYESPIIQLYKWLIWMYRYELENDYEKVNEMCDAGVAYMDEHEQFYREDKLAIFACKKQLALLHLGDYEQGQIHAQKYRKLYKDNLDVWLDLTEYFFLLAMHEGKATVAKQLLDEVVEHRKYKEFSEETKDKWWVFEVYCAYLRATQEGLEVIRTRSRKRFRLQRFLEEPIKITRSKTAMFTLLLLAQALFFVEKRSFGLAFERMQRLKSYATRKLKKDRHFRLMQFVRLMQQLAKAEFEYENIGVHQKYLDRLDEKPFKYRGLPNELEILPFEWIWEHVISKS